MGINLKDYEYKFDEEDEKMLEEMLAPYIADMEETQKEYDKITPKSFILWLQEGLLIVDETDSTHVDTEEYKIQAHVNYLKDKVEEFLKENELNVSHYAPDGFSGYEYMFTEWLTAFKFNNKKYIAEDLYGQGERIFKIVNPEKESTKDGYNGYTSVVNYLEIEDIIKEEQNK